jgi:hypothetical protein
MKRLHPESVPSPVQNKTLSLAMETFVFYMRHAVLYGLEESVLLYHFIYWTKINRSRENNFREGRHWSYTTLESLNQLFPFWTLNQIRRVRDSLVKQEVLIARKDFNRFATDRTTWYALVEEELLCCSDLLKPTNGIVGTGSSTFVETHNSDLLKSTNDNKDTDRLPDTQPKKGETPASLFGDDEPASAKPRKVFVPPTEDEVRDRFISINVPRAIAISEAKKFMAHYGSVGWMVGKKKMVSWTHAVSGWAERGGFKTNEPNTPNQRDLRPGDTGYSAAVGADDPDFVY